MTDLARKREIAKEADATLKSDAWEWAKANHRQLLLNELVTASTTERKLDIVGQLKTLEEIYGQFKALINDYNADVRKLQSQHAPMKAANG